MRFAACLAGFLILAASPASGQTGVIRDDYAGCLSEQLLDEVLRASARQDIPRINQLIGQGCFNLRGWSYTVERRGFMKSTIRVNRAGADFVLWTITEAIR